LQLDVITRFNIPKTYLWEGDGPAARLDGKFQGLYVDMGVDVDVDVDGPGCSLYEP
jgi:hypothetical protein